MNLDKIIERMIEKHSLRNVLGQFLELQPFDKFLLALANHCVFSAQNAKKKDQNKWYRMARVLHRARDEMVMKNKPFKIARKDMYHCSKCDKKFQVDPATELNIKLNLIEGLLIVTCPFCGLQES